MGPILELPAIFHSIRRSIGRSGDFVDRVVLYSPSLILGTNLVTEMGVRGILRLIGLKIPDSSPFYFLSLFSSFLSFILHSLSLAFVSFVSDFFRLIVA